MKRLRRTLVLWLTMCCILAAPSLAFSQDTPPDQDTPQAPPADDLPDDPAPPPPTDDALTPKKEDVAPGASRKIDPEAAREAARKTWKDIVVLPRRPFLKRYRVELMPFIGTTVNDTLIQHTAFGGELNFFLTEILAVGARGIYYLNNVQDQEFLVRYHFGRIPSLNKYIGTVTGDFSYVPIYGKFSLFNKHIFHYEVMISGGVGVTFTEVIPRNLQNAPFSNVALTFPVGIGARFFLTRWMAFHASIRNFMMLDKFEDPNRPPDSTVLVNGAQATPDQAAAQAKDQGNTTFINNVIVTFGVSFFFPLDFKYTTFR